MVYLVSRDNGFSNLEIEEDSKLIIDSYNKKSSITNEFNYSKGYLEAICVLFDLNIDNCCCICRKTNRSINCLIKKCIYNDDSKFLELEFPRDIRKFVFKDFWIII